MADERKRKSRRLSGEEPPAAPSPSVAGVKSRLRGLLATDSAQGRASFNSDRAKAWNFDVATSTSSSTSISSMSLPSPFGIGAKNAHSQNQTDAVLFDGRSTVDDVDDDDDDDDCSMKLIPYDELRRMIRKSCICRTCGSPVKLSQETYGLATNLYLKCCPRDRRWAVHNNKMECEEIGLPKCNDGADDGQNDNDRRSKPSSKIYLINSLAVLAMQQLGMGLDGLSTITGTLGIRSSIGNYQTWRSIQDRVGIAEQEVKDEVLAENVEKAISLALACGATKDDDGRVGLVCSVDGAWQKQSSGRKYDSPSGHNVLVDCRTKLILDVIVYSKLCSVCDRKKAVDDDDDDDESGPDIDDDDVVDDEDDATEQADADAGTNTEHAVKHHRCPKNFAGSSKSMESKGAVELVERAWRGGKFWVQAIIGDDDSTSRAALTMDLKQYEVDHPNEAKENYWPKEPNKDGKLVYVKNKGKLHWSVNGPTAFYCDPTHRTRVIGKHMFAMAAQTAKTDVTKADAQRIKRNIGYAHKQFRGKTFEEYKTAMKGALLHLGNDHSCCDASWCPFKSGKKDENDNENYLRKGTKRWNNIASVVDTYTTEEMLRMTHHPYDSQKNESLNTKTTMVAPKNKTFCKTMSLSDRIAFVTIVDSIGYDAGISRIISKLAGGKPIVIPPALQTWMRQVDSTARRKKRYQELPATKKKRAKAIKEKIKELIADDKKARKRGLDYGPGIAVAAPAGEPKDPPTAAAASKGDDPKTTTVVCSRCGEAGHARITSKKCRFYVAPKKRNSSGHIKDLTVEEQSNAGSNGNKNST